MFLDDPVNKAIRLLILDMLDLPDGFVHPANQTDSPAGAQSDPFATVLIVQADPQGKFQTLHTPDPSNELMLLETVIGMYHVVSSVQFFRAGATDYARTLKAALETSAGIEYMQANNMGFIRTGSVLNLTGVVDTFFEERAKVDLEMYVTTSVTKSLATFGKFPITVKTKNDSLTFEVSEP